MKLLQMKKLQKFSNGGKNACYLLKGEVDVGSSLIKLLHFKEGVDHLVGCERLRKRDGNILPRIPS